MVIPRVRYSLLTAVSITMLIASAMHLFVNREAWVFIRQKIIVSNVENQLTCQVSSILPSSTGRYLFLQLSTTRSKNVCTSIIYDCDRNQVQKEIENSNEVKWNPRKEQCLLVSPRKAWIISLTKEESLMEFVSNDGDTFQFTSSGKYLIHENSRTSRFLFYDTETWKLISDISLVRYRVDNIKVSANDKYVLFNITSRDSSSHELQVFDIRSNEKLWAWAPPLQVLKIQADFRGENRILFRTEDIRENFSKWFESNLVAKSTIIDSGCKVELPEESLSSYYPCSFSNDRTWIYGIEPEYCGVTIRESESGKIISMLDAKGEQVTRPIAMSANMKRVFAVRKNGELASWSRRRRILEWYGVVFQYEFLIFLCCLIFFLSSVYKDWSYLKMKNK